MVCARHVGNHVHSVMAAAEREECDKNCCCIGHCFYNHNSRMKTLSQLRRGDSRLSGVTDVVLYPDVLHDDSLAPLDVGLLPLDIDDEVWRIFTALETKFSLE